jgi:4-azaleucine resistance transporter AzlC
VRAALPVLPLAIVFGVTFGLAARDAGLAAATAVGMSALTFAGSAQFAAVGVLTTGGAPLVAVLAGLLATIRYLPMGIAGARHARGKRWRRFLGAQTMIDESWALAHGDGGFSWARMECAGTIFWMGWVGGTALGSIAGPLFGDLDRLGLDGGLAAIFLALAVGQIRTRVTLTAALLGVAIALASTTFLPAGVPVAAASLACLVALRR